MSDVVDSSTVKEYHFNLIIDDTLYQIGHIQNTSIWFNVSVDSTGGTSSMDIDVRLAGAQDRSLIEEFYVREGKNFQQLILHSASTPVGASSETMFVIAVVRGMVAAALKLDIARDPALGRVGFIRYFEIEDELEGTDLGQKMLDKTSEIAEDKGLKALDAVFNVSRADLFDLYTESGFREERKEIYLRKDFRPSVFD
ncbi:MAG: hypothetical protein PVJ05_11125 [Candidatus Thorarchaeota archaeon]|jgi:hypothetical protein